MIKPWAITKINIDKETFINSPVLKKWIESLDENHPTRKLLEETKEKYDLIKDIIAASVSDFTTDNRKIQEEDYDQQRDGNDD
jgi:hypothetical protein